MKKIRGYKTELKLTNVQRTLCVKSAGTARFTYNWGLRIKIDEYEKTGKSPNYVELHRRLVVLKQAEFSWMYEVSKSCPQEALRNLERAFKNFFRRVKTGKKPGFPKFKSRERGKGSFRLMENIRVTEEKIKLPRLGWLKLKEKNYLPTNSKILYATVSEHAGLWFVSVQVEEDIPETTPPNQACGVDVGITHLATLDDGTTFENPKAMRAFEEQLQRQQRIISRRQKGSQNRKKAVRKLQRLHKKIANIRKDAIHKATTTIVSYYGVIGIESLNVKGMLKNHKLAKSVADASFSEFHRQLKYKSDWNGRTLVKVDPFYPSSKTCSQCGWKNETLTLLDRVFHCEHCGFVIDRDHNAALNLRQHTASSAEINACGEER